MSWRTVLRRVAAAPFRILPVRVRRRVIESVARSYFAATPRDSLRALLQADDDLTALISDAAFRYEGGIHPKHRLTGYHDFFVERILPGERVLDIGCGYGAVAHTIATRTTATVVGIDLDQPNIELACVRYQAPNLRYVFGDALVELPDETFDVIVFSNVLEHLDDRVGFLRAAQQRLRPSRWLIRVPMLDRDWRVPLRKELGMFYFNDATHRIEYTRETFSDEMREAGLSIEHLQVNWGEIWAEVRAA